MAVIVEGDIDQNFKNITGFNKLDTLDTTQLLYLVSSSAIAFCEKPAFKNGSNYTSWLLL
jgi:hypothetical protein